MLASRESSSESSLSFLTREFAHDELIARSNLLAVAAASGIAFDSLK